MILRRTGEAPGSAERSQSTLIGMVLLVGMVATLSFSFFLVAGEAVTEVEQQSEEERVEGAFVELSQQLHTASSSEDVSRTIDLDVGQNGAVVREETGVINVTSGDLPNDAIDDLTIGTIEYESDDGTTMAYEAGAVFREKGNETRVVSAPSIHYDTVTKTLTLPVVTATGEEELGSGDVTFTHNETKTFQNASVVENESVTIHIESDYYRGWEEFFRTQAGDTSVREVDHENRTIEVQVGYLDVDEAYEDGILVSENFDDFDNADVEDGTVRKGSMPELDSVIDEMVADHQGAAAPSDSGTEAGDTTYFTDELHIDENDELTFETSDGNTTVIVDGNITVEGDLVADPETTDNELKIYTTEHLDIEGGNVSVENGNAGQLQVYGTSNTHVGIGPGGSSFEGTIYAPRDEPWGNKDNEVFHQGQCQEQVCMQSNVEYTGALIASSTNVHSASVTFTYDTALEDNDISLYPESYSLPPQLTYLNVAHHEVEVEKN